MNFITGRLLGIIIGALAGATVFGLSWFLYFFLYVLYLRTISLSANSIIFDIGPVICAGIGAVSGAVLGGAIGLVSPKRHNAYIVFGCFAVALVALVMSDEAIGQASQYIRVLLMGSVLYHTVAALLTVKIEYSLFDIAGITEETHEQRVWQEETERFRSLRLESPTAPPFSPYLFSPDEADLFLENLNPQDVALSFKREDIYRSNGYPSDGSMTAPSNSFHYKVADAALSGKPEQEAIQNLLPSGNYSALPKPVGKVINFAA